MTQVNKAGICIVCGGTMKVITCIEDPLVIRRKGANPIQLEKRITDAMNLVDIGDWQPRHGRGVITIFREVAQSIQEVA